MNRLLTIAVLLTCLLLAACGSKRLESYVEDGAERLNAAHIKQLLTNSIVAMTGTGGDEAELHFKTKGKVMGKNVEGDKDPGHWKVTANDTLCLEFRLWGEGNRHCYQVYGNDEKKEYYLFNSKGMLMYTATITQQGNMGTFQEGITDRRATATAAPAPAAAPHAASATNGPPPLTPAAAQDIQYIMRQSARNCPGCNLARAILASANLMAANLEGANLTGADLNHAVLRRANLRGANLYQADLTGADLTGADLTGANLTGAILDQAVLDGAKGITPQK